MPVEYAHLHVGFMKQYVASGAKYLLGKPRTLPAQTKDGNVVQVSLVISEEYSKDTRRFIATLKRAEQESTDEDMDVVKNQVPSDTERERRTTSEVL